MIDSRRQAREAALQVLYSLDALEDWQSEMASLLFQNFFQLSADDLTRNAHYEFASLLVNGVIGGREKIDAALTAASTNWTLARMGRVDRNILRAAACEFSLFPETPKNVVINESLEIAKRFSTDEAILFINGVLEKIAGQAALANNL